MPISHNLKTIFIHIPKNAGESIEEKLGIYGNSLNPLEILWGIHGKYVLQHLTMAQMKRLYITDDIYKSYFKFSFVRNPWDKTVSEYYWYKNYGRPLTFKGWVKGLKDRLSASGNLNLYEVGHNIPQYRYLYDDHSNLLVDFVGRFENLQEDFNHVCRAIGIEDSGLPQLQRTASVGRKRYKEYYDNETRDIIAGLYEKDIELFGYEY